MTKPPFPHSLTAEIIQALRSSSYWTEKTKETDNYIERLTCPECGEQRAYAHRDKPFAILCNRQNCCGAITKTIPLLDIMSRFEERCQPSKEHPHRPAREFLLLRSLSADLLQKTKFEYRSNTRKGCGGGVFFPVGKAWSGRLFSPPPGEGKTHTIGALDGQFWQLDAKEYSKDKPLHITEGIINALSLFAMGQQAVALVAANTDPKKFDLTKLQGLGSELVLAFDGDAAGAKYTKRWTAYLKQKGVEFSAILPVKGDWNDLLTDAETPEEAAERFEEEQQDYATEARLALANTAQEYAQIYTKANGYAPGLFPFNGCYWWSSVKESKDEDLITTVRVSDFTLSVNHFQISEKDPDRPEFKYSLRIKPRKGRSINALATGTDLKSSDTLRGFFFNHAKASWTGSTAAAYALGEIILHSEAPEVRQAEQMGHDPKTGWHILKHVAISPKGQVVQPEKGGYFRLSGKDCIRPFWTDTLKPEPSDKEFFKAEVVPAIKGAWGDKGLAALSFLTASLFVNKVKPELGFFPFLSLCGDRSTGKTKLIRTLNNMQGLNEEGLPINGANTQKGQLNVISQVSGMMKALLEGNDKSKAKFDYDCILTGYNYGNPLKTSAKFSNDNREETIPFNGTISFVQNIEQFDSPAQKSRVISLPFKQNELNSETKAAHDKLIAIAPQKLAGFLLLVLQDRGYYEANWKPAHDKAKELLASSLPDNRINENHAVLLAFHNLLCDRFGLDYDLLPYLEQVGKEKMKSCEQRKHTAADHFFDVLEAMPESIKDKNGKLFEKESYYHIKDGLLYIRRVDAERAIRAAEIPMDWPGRLLDSLQKHPAFLESSKKHRFPGKLDAERAMVFDANLIDC
jgi:hypothetical protein